MATLSFEHLFKLRLVVARYGEMDGARWWNTKGVLGRYGAMALGRGFPRTHRFAQAGIAFSVAARRCGEIYETPTAATLWNLPAEKEDRFREKWHDWIENAEPWWDFFKGIENIDGKSLLDLLIEQDLITQNHVETIAGLRLADEGRSVPLPGSGTLNDERLNLLAAAFAKGEPGKPAIPFLPLNRSTIESDA